MRAVIFDLGNVLVNYDGRDTFLGLAELTAVSPQTIYAHYQTVETEFGTGQLGGRAYYALLQKTFGLKASYETFAATFCRNQARNEPALAFACELHAQTDVTVGIISNTNEIHAGWLHANLPELSQFSSVILSNEVGLLKPEAAIYQLALEQLGVPPHQALFVDDLLENVAGGTAIGMTGYHHAKWQDTRSFINNWLNTPPKPNLPKK